jgi:DNA-binding CsgD family transcriptional regulator/PAS domain-containing protein
MREEEAFSEAIGALYDCILDPGKWTNALRQLSRYVGGSSALLFHQDHRSGAGGFLQSYNADPGWTRLYFEKYVQLNPVLPLTAFMDVGSSTSLSRVMDMEEYRGTRFYAEWAATQRFHDVVVTVLAKSASAMGMFGVTRLEDEGLAGESEIRRMDLVSPHVRRAVTIARLFDGVRAQGAALTATFDAMSDAVWLLDAAGVVLFANAASRGLTEGDGPVAQVGGRFAFRDSMAMESLNAALRGLRNGGPVGEFPVSSPDDRPFIAYLVSLAPKGRPTPVSGAPVSGVACALFMRPVVADEMPPMQALAQLYGLTPREFQVFTGLLQFGGVPEVARNFGLSATTVRSHLQNIFDKTGVRSQSDLARLAASSVPPVVSR